MRVLLIVPLLLPLLAPGQTPRPTPATPSSPAATPSSSAAVSAAKASPAAGSSSPAAALAAQPDGSGIRAAAILEEAMKDKNPDTRKQAVQSIGLIGPREPWVSRLDSMLGDKDVEVRLATVASLLDLNDRVVLPMLRKAVNDEVPEVSFAAAKALWAMSDPQGKGALLAVLSGEMKTSSGFITTQRRDALPDDPYSQNHVHVRHERRSRVGPGARARGGEFLPCRVSFRTRAHPAGRALRF